MYHYFKCKRNNAHQRLAVAEVFGAYATPNCSDCGGPTLKIGQGTAPVAPPDLPALGPLPVLADNDAVIFSGSGDHGWRGNVTYTVKKNDAKQHVIVEVAIAARPLPYIVRFNSTLLGGGNNQDTPVTAPFGGGYWHTLNTTSDQMQRVAQAQLDASMAARLNLPAPIRPDAQINFGLKLGNAAFGLIHMIAGHHDDLRTLTGAGIAVISSSDPSEQAAMEQYRSFAAIQAGLQQCLGDGSLQAIFRDEANANKWIFAGLWKEKAVIVVTQKEGGVYYMTTLFIGAPAATPGTISAGRRRLAWKRARAKIPPGW